MAIIPFNTDPSRTELRNFDRYWFPAFVAVVGLVVWRKTGALEIAAIIWALALPSLLLSFVAPRVMKPVFVGLMYLSYPIGFVLSHVMFFVFYVTTITPIGLFMRLIGRDALRRKRDPGATTYWTKREPETDTKRYFKQF